MVPDGWNLNKFVILPYYRTGYVFRNVESLGFTVEVHYTEDEYGDGFYYVFPAKNGVGIPNSPYVFYECDYEDAEKEALKKAQEIMNSFPDGKVWQLS